MILQGKSISVAIVVAVVSTVQAYADVTISDAQTQNMTCSAGVCVPTASDAVFNVDDLEGLLAAGNVEVTTTGSGVQANNVVVTAALGWSSGSILTLNAYESITIAKTISVAGLSGLSLVTNEGGSGGLLSIARMGHVIFQNLSDQLSINGTAYMLTNSIASLATAIAANPAGAYALAADYDAAGDGTYATAPIHRLFGELSKGLETKSQISLL